MRAWGEVRKPWAETEVMSVAHAERERMVEVYCILKFF